MGWAEEETSGRRRWDGVDWAWGVHQGRVSGGAHQHRIVHHLLRDATDHLRVRCKDVLGQTESPSVGRALALRPAPFGDGLGLTQRRLHLVHGRGRQLVSYL